jgi:hypothetical protein
VQPSSFFMKNTLIGWVIAGYGVRSASKFVMLPDSEQSGFFEGFQEVLRKILPPSLGFNEVEIRNYEVVFVCNGGRDEFVLETASGGVSALIDMAWQIYMFATDDRREFTVLIDEVENHLHPSMQRRVLQDFIGAFPQVRFIVATHSPLIVSSVKDSNVYALMYNDRQKIVSTPLDLRDKAKTATEILDEVLGVSTTMPIWVEDKLQAILAKYSLRTIAPEDLMRLRGDLAEIGLEKLMPSAITAVLGGPK